MNFDKIIEQFQQIDLSAPDASWQLFMLMMSILPWKFMIWYTIIGVIGGAIIGWYKKTLWRDVLISLLLGPPIGWIISLLLPANHKKCAACGYQNWVSAKVCKQCGEVVKAPSPELSHKKL